MGNSNLAAIEIEENEVKYMLFALITHLVQENLILMQIYISDAVTGPYGYILSIVH